MSFDLRLVRYGPAGAERPGLIDGQGRLRDLSYVLIDLDATALDADEIDILRAIEPATLPPVSGAPRLGLPVAGARIVAIDGAAVRLAPIGQTDRPRESSARLGLAALFAGQDHISGYLMARVAEDFSWAALGPWLIAPETPPRPARLTSLDRPLKFAAPGALASETSQAAGDVRIILCDPSTPLDAQIDGFGPPPPPEAA